MRILGTSAICGYLCLPVVQLQKQEQMLRRQQLSIKTAQSSLAELTAKQEKLHEEGRDLKTERDVLLEHVNGLQAEVMLKLMADFFMLTYVIAGSQLM